MRKLIFSIALVSFFPLAVGSVSAQTVTTAPTGAHVTTVPTHAVPSEEQLARLKNKATREINRRIAKLNQVLKLINSIKRLTESQKSTLTSQVQGEIAKLTATQTKINSITTVAALKAEVQALDKSYRVFALYVPKIQIIAKADKTLATTEKVSSLAAKLETRISSEKAKGKNVAAAEAHLVDLKKQLTEAKTNAQGAIDKVMPLTPEGNATNKAALQASRKLLLAAHTNLKAANKDIKEIKKVLGLQGLLKNAKIRRNSLTPRPTREDKQKPTRTPRPTREFKIFKTN